MNQSRLSYSARGRVATLRYFFNRYLTLISVTVLLIGLALILLGPVRAILGSLTPAAPRGNQGPNQSVSGPLTGGANPAPFDLIERQFVAFTTIPDRPRNKVIGYTIKPGDTLFGIAGEFGLKPETLFWSNKNVLNDDIHLIIPGTTLAIIPADGVYTTADGVSSLEAIVNANNGDVSAVVGSPYNELAGYAATDVPPWGMKIVIPGGHREIISWTPAVSAVTVTDKAGRTTTVYGYRQGMPGSCAAGIKGGGGTGAWLVPISPGSYSIAQGFAPWHSGIDMAANIGTTVRAADTGVIIFSGWDETGYGNLVILDHGNGWITYYGHLNSRAVGCGQTVQRGGTIGAVGTTGHSTGPHLHFEMRWQDRPDNPASYIGF